jgi:chemotaxis signal transduction protein
MMEKMDRHLSAHDRMVISSFSQSENQIPLRTKVTVFKVGERLFGVESEQVMKLFKIPDHLTKKINQLKRFRLKEFDVRMIHLENFFSISEDNQEEGKQVLILKGNGEYKGVIMDRVLNRLSGPLEKSGESNEYILGMMRWTYQDFPIKVPVLDFKKL